MERATGQRYKALRVDAPFAKKFYKNRLTFGNVDFMFDLGCVRFEVLALLGRRLLGVIFFYLPI